METLLPLLALALGLVGLFGWSHRNLTRKIDELERLLLRAPQEAEVRRLIDDKLAPFKVETIASMRRIDEMYNSITAMYAKLDYLVEQVAKHGGFKQL